VVLIAHNPEWSMRFKLISDRLRRELRSVALSVDHIGSTSVPGLASKDRVDVMITVATISDAAKVQLDAALQDGGFQMSIDSADHRPPGDDSSPDEWKKFYVRGTHADFPFHSNIHVRALGRRNHAYALLFRDYLRANADAAKAYEAVKFRLAEHIATIETYVDIKDPVCDIAMAGARAWAERSGWNVASAMSR
jgi:GrpB-like predicted nucleotidyltransferase (UPF0157 family)